ncbi:MAG: AAA family ATPase [Synergistota bacterium]|nr:AAA family ATPase [Synergistota bacterium]
MDKESSFDLFSYGSTWLRADFHLHTDADKEFIYTGDEDDYYSNYVGGLVQAGIGLGVITNHNKFNLSEFKALRKTAKKEGICLLPGVELSTSDGSNGVHTLIVFEDRWLENGNDYISPFISSMFPGKAESEYQHENGRSDKTILQAVEELDKTARDYFLIFAHVEQSNGLWKEMSGGRLKDFAESRYESVRRRCLGFQKVRTYHKEDSVCRTKIKDWLGDWYPAEVEGSDCKSIEEIGRGRRCFLKLGALSFDAVKFALIDKGSRVSSEPVLHDHSHIRCVRFTGGILNGKELNFSPELNTLIGIRGSGKSSVLEVLRYCLDIPFGKNAVDQRYKEELVGFALGSGGKVEIEAVDRHGQLYTIRRVWGETYSDVLIDGKLQPGVSIRETVVHKPIYFGQKDLSNTGHGFEKDLVDKLLGSRLEEVRRKIEGQKRRVVEAVDHMLKVDGVQEQIEEQREIRKDTEYRLKLYRDNGVEEKLKKRLDFDKDAQILEKGIGLVEAFVFDLEDLLARNEDEIRNFKGYVSVNNGSLFDRFYEHYEMYVSFVTRIKEWLREEKNARKSLSECKEDFLRIRRGMLEEFADVERKLSVQLHDSDIQNISTDEFLKLKQRLSRANQFIAEFEKQIDRQAGLRDVLLTELAALNDLWLEEFNVIKSELDEIISEDSPLSIEFGYKADSQEYLSFMKEIFKGSGVRESTYRGIVDRYVDFIDIYKDFENAKDFFGSNPQNLVDRFMDNLKTLLTWQRPNKFTIRYHDKELKNHSLGQRASALILFVLSQRENDLVIIDQPEDDLDNQTIYEDVIKLIRQMKPTVQFIFATHNPNIPVLGDAELVHGCSFAEDSVQVQSGSIDDRGIQQTVIRIMEGGREAFNRRKEIYQIWKS